MNASYQVSLLINTDRGPIPLDRQREWAPLPSGPFPGTPVIHYGPYLRALEGFFAQNDHKPLRSSLSAHFQRAVDTHEIQSMEIISEKHGAYYHVARVRVTLLDTICSLGINAAVTESQHSALEREFETLLELRNRLPLPYLPRPYFKGETPLSDPFQRHQRVNRLTLLVVEWFQGYHEFHLSEKNRSGVPALRLWESDEKGDYLSPAESRSLYYQASCILTSYLDVQSFEQIFPWHHGAGDFVARRTGQRLEVRLIAARERRTLVSWDTGGPDPWLGALHFFFGLSVRMRLDRLDGTGPLAWASPLSLFGVLDGFLAGWDGKTVENPSLPSRESLLALLCSMNQGEWLSFGEAALQDLLVEEEEASFLESRMEEHAAALIQALLAYRHEDSPIFSK